MEKREEGCRGRLYKGIAKRSIIMDLCPERWYKVQERAMRRLPRGRDKGKLCSTPLQASGYGFFSLSTIELPLLSSALPFFFSFFNGFVFPQYVYASRPFPNALFVASFPRLAAFLSTTVGQNEGEWLQLDI